MAQELSKTSEPKIMEPHLHSFEPFWHSFEPAYVQETLLT